MDDMTELEMFEMCDGPGNFYVGAHVTTIDADGQQVSWVITKTTGTKMTLRRLTRRARLWRWLTSPLRRVYWWIWRRF